MQGLQSLCSSWFPSAVGHDDTQVTMEEEDENFCRDVTDVVGIRQCFDDNGVVAVTGVLTKAECDATLADMGMPAVFDIRDPSTYALPEVEAALNPYGVVGKDVLWTKAIVRNRFHPNVASAYQVSQCNENVTAIRPFFLHKQWWLASPGRVRSWTLVGMPRSGRHHAPHNWGGREGHGHRVSVPGLALGRGSSELLHRGRC
jgi:hypothetical protein